MVIQDNIKFAREETAPGLSNTFFNGTSDVLSLEITGTFTSAVVMIEGRISTFGDWVPLAAVSLSDYSAYKNGITAPGIYEISIISIRELRLNIASIEGGDINVIGQLISSEEM